MEYYFLFKFPIMWVIFQKMEIILKTIKGLKEPEHAIDRSVLRNFLLAYWLLLFITVFM